jgi:hypothetical protein
MNDVLYLSHGTSGISVARRVSGKVGTILVVN